MLFMLNLLCSILVLGLISPLAHMSLNLSYILRNTFPDLYAVVVLSVCRSFPPQRVSERMLGMRLPDLNSVNLIWETQKCTPA